MEHLYYIQNISRGEGNQVHPKLERAYYRGVSGGVLWGTSSIGDRAIKHYEENPHYAVWTPGDVWYHAIRGLYHPDWQPDPYYPLINAWELRAIGKSFIDKGEKESA